MAVILAHERHALSHRCELVAVAGILRGWLSSRWGQSVVSPHGSPTHTGTHAGDSALLGRHRRRETPLCVNAATVPPRSFRQRRCALLASASRSSGFDASGDATLYSYVIHHRPLPQWETEGPRSVAIVELAEGPRLISSVVGCDQTPEALKLDMPLQAVFVPFDDITVLCFEPKGQQS